MTSLRYLKYHHPFVDTGESIVLLVEDESDHVLMIRQALYDAAAKFLPQVRLSLQVAEDGDQAQAYLAGYERYSDRGLYPLPALILLDLKLRRKSGFELLGWLRRHPGLKRMPVIVLTSSEDIKDIDQAYELGANSYLVKPLWSEDGLEEMMNTLGQYWVAYNRKPTVQSR